MEQAGQQSNVQGQQVQAVKCMRKAVVRYHSAGSLEVVWSNQVTGREATGQISALYAQAEGSDNLEDALR
jgi:hypothetical protein